MKKSSAPRKSADITDAAVRARTGKTWAEWFAVLDRVGAARMSHKAIAAYLHESQGCSAWWSQMVTVGYERERGLRVRHQTATGFVAHASRTLPVALPALFAAWESEEARGRWLPAPGFAVRTAKPNKSLRGTWGGGRTSLEVLFYAKGEGKSQVTVQHGKLKSAKEVQRLKAYWTAALDRLRERLTADGSAPAGPARPAVAAPDELSRALASSPRARAAFAALPPSHRREYVRYVETAKRPQTRARRADLAVQRLLAGKAPR
jgi:hypothetical protein